jgi:5-methylcytosine-specific restriction endonuclease McrA
MIGKIRKKLLSSQESTFQVEEVLVCPICERPIPSSEKDAHHLIPKSKGGKSTQFLHRICHRQIHALLSETQLAKEFNTAAALKEHPSMQQFISWVRTKPNHFYERTSKSTTLKMR